MTTRSIAKPTDGNNRTRKKLTDYGGSSSWDGSKDSFNVLHQVYRGKMDRMEKYRTHDWMEQDSDISRSLDLIAEHCAEKNSDNRYFQFDWYTDEPTAELSGVLKAHLDQWSRINKLKKSLFKVVRNTLKYGDWFMFRDPTTFELYDIHPMDVLGAIVDKNTLDILGWVVRDFRWNVTDLEINVDSKEVNDSLSNFNKTSIGGNDTQQSRAIPAIHMIHFSMSEGKLATSSVQGNASRGANVWPFGNSWLDKAHKSFKQRELLEDAMLIHRVQRAPSRHVWYIDTGKMRHDRTKYVIQNFKNELNQKRIPQFIGNESKSVDSVYNPISQLEDYYIPVSMDARGSKVEQLEGTPWTDLPDLDYFKKKVASALRVPFAWMQPAGEGGGISPSDGRAGVATQEEIEFSRFCSRVQSYLIDPWDHEFKLYARWRDVNANWADFELTMNPPTDYQASKDRSRLVESINAFKDMAEIPFMSKRLAMKEALGWSDDKIAENEKMVDEENSREETTPMDAMGSGAGLSIDADMPMGGGLEPADSGMSGADSMGGGMDAMGGDDMGGGDLGGMGSMESMNVSDDNKLFEIELPKPKLDMSGSNRTPDDKSIGGSAPIKGKPVATLDMIQRLRHAQFSKRVDWQKRLKMLNRIYSPTNEPDAGPPMM
jgi:hypothetical protein